MDYSTLDDRALLVVIAGRYGKPATDSAFNEAVGVLYDRYGRLVYSVAIHITGDAQTAEEVTQDVFFRACEAAQSYRPESGKVSSWLTGITRNRAIDELRRRQARPEHRRADWPEDLGLDHTDGLPVTDGPEEAVETSLRRAGLRSVLLALPDEQRRVLGMAFFSGLSHSQIAAALGEPLGTVKSRIRLAMQKLRETINEQGMIDG